jgi:hypothetical protein
VTLERERPYNHEEVQQLYPVLTEVECRLVSHLEHQFRAWQVWPHVDYPQVHLWLARRAFTSMTPIVVAQLGDMPGEINFWLHDHSSKPNPWGSSST